MSGGTMNPTANPSEEEDNLGDVGSPSPPYEEVIANETSGGRARTPHAARNLGAFWLFGLLNNYAYVIMLSAAHDILAEQKTFGGYSEEPNVSPATSHNGMNYSIYWNGTRDCNAVSTSAVLLCDILPTLILKSIAPLFVHYFPFGPRVFFVIATQAISFLIVGSSGVRWLSLTGVVFASISSGLGEITFLAMSAHFNGNVISTWSSGTGMSGVAGSVLYALLTDENFANLSPSTTVYIMLVCPVAFAIAYWFIAVIPDTVPKANLLQPKTWLIKPAEYRLRSVSDTEVTRPLLEVSEEDETSYSGRTDDITTRDPMAAVGSSNQAPSLSFAHRLRLIKPLLRYMIPLGLVYFAEYFINQGLHELIYFGMKQMTHEAQYRWYQVLYQIGVLISRSSVNILHIKGYWLYLLPLLQFINLAVFFSDAVYFYIPSVYILMALILYEGLLGGASYVNTFYQIRKEVDPKYTEYSLGVASVGDSLGITIAAFTSMPTHNWICSLPQPH